MKILLFFLSRHILQTFNKLSLKMIVYKVNLLHSLLTIHRGSFVTNVATKLQEINHVLQFKTKSIKN